MTLGTMCIREEPTSHGLIIKAVPYQTRQRKAEVIQYERLKEAGKYKASKLIYRHTNLKELQLKDMMSG